MPRRLPQTLADYVVVAIAPTLIVLLVGSLLFFVIELVYPPEWHARLRWVCGWYVIAIVGISRISLEQGWAYASIFAGALSVAVALVVPPASWPLLAAVWWAAHQLTRDTTLIDETEDASGQGLWETAVGAEVASPAPLALQEAPQPPGPRLPLAAKVAVRVQRWLTGEELSRPHAPGKWVIYFCVAAVPLFGFGGWLVSPGPGRSWAMTLLVVYTACGLGLLLSTSFLGLRRYLRQRQVVMPPEMTAVWLVAGSLTILATLLLAAVLPRPTPEYSVLGLGRLAALNVRRASPWGWGREGLPEDATPDAATTPGASSSSDASAEQQSQKPQQQAGASEQERASKSVDDARKTAKAAEDQAQHADRPSASKADALRQPAENQAAGPRVPSRSAEARPSRARSRWAELPGTLVRGLGQSLATLLRTVVTLAGLCLIAWVLWTYRAELAQAWWKLLDDLAALWGSRRVAPSAAQPPSAHEPPPRPFASFADPFATGSAGKMPWPELVRYTFSALEAWGREQGCPRRADQTPQEFVTELLRGRDLPGEPLALLAAWYSELAYAPRQAQRARPVAPLKTLWDALHSSGQGI